MDGFLQRNRIGEIDTNINIDVSINKGTDEHDSEAEKSRGLLSASCRPGKPVRVKVWVPGLPGGARAAVRTSVSPCTFGQKTERGILRLFALLGLSEGELMPTHFGETVCFPPIHQLKC